MRVRACRPATVSDGSPIRVAFVGQDVYFRVCSLAQPAGGLEPTFVDFRTGARESVLLAALERLDPDVVVVFRPEIIPRGLFGLLRAMTVGYLTEPLPRKRLGSSSRPRGAHGGAAAGRSGPSPPDRLVRSVDRLVRRARAEGVVLPCQSRSTTRSSWTCTSAGSRRDSCSWAGPRSTARRFSHRSSAVIGSSHIGHGLHGPQLMRFLASADVQLNLHNHPYPTFENRVCLALAAGHLVISEPLSPDHGLRAGRDFLEADDADTFLSLVDELSVRPGGVPRCATCRTRAGGAVPRLPRLPAADQGCARRCRRAREPSPASLGSTAVPQAPPRSDPNAATSASRSCRTRPKRRDARYCSALRRPRTRTLWCISGKRPRRSRCFTSPSGESMCR